jgi:drug/metabolite transporter (DMT)-like permease
MSHIAILLIILSATLHAVWNFLGKRSGDVLVFFWWSQVFSSAIFAPVALYLFRGSMIDPKGWYFAFASGVFVFLFWTLLCHAYQSGDLSLVYPIARSAPALVPILAIILFNEKLSPLGVVGVLAVVAGVYVLPMKSFDPKNAIQPFAHLKQKPVAFAALTAVCLSVDTMIDKVGTRFFHPLVYVWLINLVGFILLTPYITLSARRRVIREEWRANKWAAAAAGILIILSYSLIVFVMRFEKITYIISMRQISIVIGVFLGHALLKEKHGSVRFVASCLIFLGVFCTGLAE